MQSPAATQKIVVVGCSHRVAPVEVREALFPDAERIEAFFSAVREGRFKATEAAMVYTCSRVEFYLVSNRPAVTEARVRDWFLGDRSESRAHTYALSGPAAVEHFFSVCAGLDSIMVGEHEILGQVRSGLEESRQRGTVDTVLDRFFQAGLRAGRRARAETDIGKGGTSLAFAAADVARSEVPPSQRGRAVVVGAGITGRLAATHLAEAGWDEIVILNRTLSRAEEVAREVGGKALPLDDLKWAVRGARVVVTAAGGAEPLLCPDILTNRAQKPLLVVDLGRPRNVDESVGRQPGVTLVDLDRLHEVTEAYRRRRALEIPRVQPIVEEEAARFRGWLAHRAVVPMVRVLRSSFADIAEAELEKHLHEFPESEREKVSRFTRSLLNKLLHYPTTHLKELAEHGDGQEERLGVLQEIFVAAGWGDAEVRKEAS